jgi:tRNA pseudouridine55 synthase
MKELHRNADFKEGEIILIDKPLEWTSFNVVSKIRFLICRHKQYKKIKVGHAGTLDPLASGLMLICTGKSTKQVAELQQLDKEYITTIKLGEKTPSYDKETEVIERKKTDHLSRDNIEEALRHFQGTILQKPPRFSAKWIKGERAYNLARKGEDIKLEPKEVTIKNISLTKCCFPYITIYIKCSKGTYIRSIARDIGEYLKTGAHITELQRTAIGPYNIKDALTIKAFENIVSS